MNLKRWLVALSLTASILLFVITGLAAAQAALPIAETQPLDPQAPNAINNYLPVQGRLTDAHGQPLNGSYQLTFRLYDQSSGGAALCTDPRNVTVEDGLFSAFILGTNCSIDGRALYLGIQVETDPEMTPRLPVNNVPYAWSLRPGAVISSSLTNNAILHIENWGSSGRGLRSYAMATSGTNYGMVGASRSPDGYGGYFYNNNGGTGLYGQSSQPGGVGVRAEGLDSSADLVLGGNADTDVGDNGILTSDPELPNSDIILKSNDNVRIDLDNDASGEDADFEILDRNDTTIFAVDESGAVTCGGPGIAAFPRPAYDSGLVSVGAGTTKILTHNLGGNIDNYVVDLTCQQASYGRHIFGLGGDVTAGGFYGVFWKKLDSSTISVERATNDGECPQVRVRIWMYP